MKKNSGIISIIIGLILIGGVYYQTFTDKAISGIVDGRYFIGSGVSTTTGIYLTGTASSTSQIIPLDDTIDEVAVKLFFIASSTTSRFDWKYEFSDDQKEWYSPINASTTNEIIYVASTTPTFHLYTPATTLATRLFDQIHTTNANFMRITVQLGVVAQHGFVWGEIKPKSINR